MSDKNCSVIQKIPSMGSFFEIQLTLPCDRKVAPEFFVSVQKKLDEIETELSLYQKDSPIQKLNSKGALKNAPRHLVRVLQKAIEMGRKTHDIFDVTILSGKDAKVSWKDVQIENDFIHWNKKNLKITLDGIAKGYAVDLIADDFERQGYHSYLLNFSGNMRWQGYRSDGQFWKIERWNPILKKSTSLDHSESGAIASSGREHTGDHIFDARTRKPTTQKWGQTTARGPLAEICDVLSTTSFASDLSEMESILSESFQEYIIDFIDEKGAAQTIKSKKA